MCVMYIHIYMYHKQQPYQVKYRRVADYAGG